MYIFIGMKEYLQSFGHNLIFLIKYIKLLSARIKWDFRSVPPILFLYLTSINCFIIIAFYSFAQLSFISRFYSLQFQLFMMANLNILLVTYSIRWLSLCFCLSILFIHTVHSLCSFKIEFSSCCRSRLILLLLE